MQAPCKTSVPQLRMAAITTSHKDIVGRLKAAAREDPVYQAALRGETVADLTGFMSTDGLLYTQPSTAKDRSRVIVPAGAVRQVLLHDEVHDAPTSGRRGRDKVVERLKRHFFWPSMDKTVAECLRSCPICQANKASNRPPWSHSLFRLVLGNV